MATSVVCISQSIDQASRIIASLRSAGFAERDISILMADRKGARDLGHEKHTKAPEGAAAGAGTGGVLGGTLGLLAGIGALAIPGVGPFIAAGPIMAALGGAAIGAAVGGLTGTLVGLGIPEYEAKRYEGKIVGGNVLIAVHTEDNEEEKRVRKIFEEGGAEDISSITERTADVKAPKVGATP
jgi:hypothetical protein